MTMTQRERRDAQKWERLKEQVRTERKLKRMGWSPPPKSKPYRPKPYKPPGIDKYAEERMRLLDKMFASEGLRTLVENRAYLADDQRAALLDALRRVAADATALIAELEGGDPMEAVQKPRKKIGVAP